MEKRHGEECIREQVSPYVARRRTCCYPACHRVQRQPCREEMSVPPESSCVAVMERRLRRPFSEGEGDTRHNNAEPGKMPARTESPSPRPANIAKIVADAVARRRSVRVSQGHARARLCSSTSCRHQRQGCLFW